MFADKQKVWKRTQKKRHQRQILAKFKKSTNGITERWCSELQKFRQSSKVRIQPLGFTSAPNPDQLRHRRPCSPGVSPSAQVSFSCQDASPLPRFGHVNRSGGGPGCDVTPERASFAVSIDSRFTGEVWTRARCLLQFAASVTCSSVVSFVYSWS